MQPEVEKQDFGHYNGSSNISACRRLRYKIPPVLEIKKKNRTDGDPDIAGRLRYEN